jgi:hypothetical protein
VFSQKPLGKLSDGKRTLLTIALCRGVLPYRPQPKQSQSFTACCFRYPRRAVAPDRDPALPTAHPHFQYIELRSGAATADAKALNVGIPSQHIAAVRLHLIDGSLGDSGVHIRSTHAGQIGCRKAWQPLGNYQSEYERYNPMSLEAVNHRKDAL